MIVLVLPRVKLLQLEQQIGLVQQLPRVKLVLPRVKLPRVKPPQQKLLQ